MLELLAHHRRRYALRVLRDHKNPMTLADLADEVAVRTNERRITDIPADEVKRIYLSLYHSHIPILADAQLVQYDQERDTVSLSECADELEQYQDLLTVA